MRGRRSWLALVGATLGVGAAALAHEEPPEDDPDPGAATLSDLHCEDGFAERFPCWNADLLAWIPRSTFDLGPANDIWGWTDPRTGVEYAMIGLQQAVAFVDLREPTRPLYLGFLPTHGAASPWRDIKVHRDHAFVVSEARNHGMQVFDLTQLDGVHDPPVVFGETAHYAGFGSAHNLALDEETGFAYALGTRTCGSGLHMVDVGRPDEPRFAGCFSGDGYTHDAQCVVYRGPDARHRGREICFNANEDTLTLVDVTSKDAPFQVSRTGYSGRAYTHQGWLTEDHAWFLLGDEFDEVLFGHRSRTWIWDVSDLEAPRLVGHYDGVRPAIDHNLFVRGNHVFEANYRAGLRVLRMGNLSHAEMTEVANFDTHPDGNHVGFAGAWGVYPFFESGVVIVSDINRGLFVVAPHLDAVPECNDGLDNDRDGLRDRLDPSCADASGARELPRSDVAVDLRPGNAASPVHPSARGVVAAAVLGSAAFDVSQVDPATLRLGGARAERPPRRRDVDRDGFDDLLAHYRLTDAGLEGAETACLDWLSREGTPYRGCDALRPVPDPPGRGRRQ